MISFSLGMISVQFQTFPFTDIRTIYKQFNQEEKISLDYEVDIQSLIHIKNLDDVQSTRENLINYVWKGQNPPP